MLDERRAVRKNTTVYADVVPEAHLVSSRLLFFKCAVVRRWVKYDGAARKRAMNTTRCGLFLPDLRNVCTIYVTSDTWQVLTPAAWKLICSLTAKHIISWPHT